MGSPLGPTLANVFLCFHEQIWITEFPYELKLVYYIRYVNEILLSFDYLIILRNLKII